MKVQPLDNTYVNEDFACFLFPSGFLRTHCFSGILQTPKMWNLFCDTCINAGTLSLEILGNVVNV